jgi:hypothetical protein
MSNADSQAGLRLASPTSEEIVAWRWWTWFCPEDKIGSLLMSKTWDGPMLKCEKLRSQRGDWSMPSGIKWAPDVVFWDHEIRLITNEGPYDPDAWVLWAGIYAAKTSRTLREYGPGGAAMRQAWDRLTERIESQFYP